ncbi:NmrA family NAD(P)-binding protein [Massilia sp. PWRC2]|uniref:NmrA family NAD(P)-binding protein n=1 Tax=Massilia sp. PWRC2 TaxID=2804626 RepID=UPI003CE7D25A
MSTLVIGATGAVGRQVVDQLLGRGVAVRALVRDPAKAHLPASVELVQGELLAPDALRRALAGVSSLFLLNAVAADEFTQALTVLNLAREAGVQRLVYLSVMHSDRYVNVPHFAVKFGVERMIEQMGFSATILRPAYFMQNDLTVRDTVLGHGVYPMPIGAKGLAMIDTRDLAELAAIELIHRDRATRPLPTEHINVVGADTLTGADAAAVWAELLGRPVVYGGDDTAPFEQTLRQFLPHWMAYEMRLMTARFVSDGMLPGSGDRARLTAILGRPLRTYRDFVAGIVNGAGAPGAAR